MALPLEFSNPRSKVGKNAIEGRFGPTGTEPKQCRDRQGAAGKLDTTGAAPYPATDSFAATVVSGPQQAIVPGSGF